MNYQNIGWIIALLVLVSAVPLMIMGKVELTPGALISALAVARMMQ